MMKKIKVLFISILSMFGLAVGYTVGHIDLLDVFDSLKNELRNAVPKSDVLLDFDGKSNVIEINGQANFAEEDLKVSNGSWQTFSDLDSLNRVGVAEAMLHRDMMPTESREDISNVYPTGWNQKKLHDGGWLYNRSHLIGFQMTGENANWKNLFTGTQQLNQIHMVKYENEVANYLRSTNNHVRYRVTPIFRERELVPRAIQIEAKSIEDDQIDFNVLIHNIQEGISIDYTTGAATKI